MPFYEPYASKFTRIYMGDKLKQLEAKNGGSILELLKKTDAAQTPTLIIGLGGLGCRTVNQIKKKYIEFIKDDEGYIQFLAMDFAKVDLESLDIGKNGGWLKNSERCKMISNPDACRLLIQGLVKEHMHDPAQEWVDQSFNPQETINDQGARGFRQIGRLILSRSDNYSAAKKAVTVKLEALHNVIAAPGALTVILVAGISGGTGSGTIVDISYMVRDACADVFGTALGASMLFDAILYTPEVQFGIPDVDPELLQRNFTAAMKEINAFFKAQDTKTTYSFPRQGQANGALSNPAMGEQAIFSSVSIVQGYDSHGGRLPESAVIDTVASYVINTIGDYTPAGDNHLVQLSSVLNNEGGYAGNHINNMLVAHPSLPRDTVYGYRTFGFKTLTFPVEELMTILANRTMEALSDYFDKQPTRHELALLGDHKLAHVKKNPDNTYTLAQPRRSYEALFRLAGVTLDEAEKAVKTFPLDWRRVSTATQPKDIISEIPTVSPQKVDTKLDEQWQKDILDDLFRELSEEMRENGPYAALRLCERMGAVIRAILDAKVTAKNYIDDQVTSADREVKAAFNAIKAKSLLASRQPLLDDFQTALQKYWIWKNQSNLLETVYSILNRLNNEMAKRHNKVFDYFVGAFGAIAEVLSRDSTAAIETAHMAVGGTTVFSASMMNIDDVHNDMSVLAQFIKHWLTPEYISRISTNLIDNMLSNEGAWQADGNFNGVTQMKEVFKLQFKEFAEKALQKMIVIANMEPPASFGRTVDEILDVISRTVDDDQLMQNGAPLSADAKWALFNSECAVLGYKDGHTPLGDAAKKIYDSASAVGQCATLADLGSAGVGFDDTYAIRKLCLMAETPQLNAEIAALAGVTPIVGNFPGVFNLIVYCGVPLYFLKGIEESQRVYSKKLNEGGRTNAGMHMDANKTGSWAEFPPLVNNRIYKLKYAGKGTAYQTYADYIHEDERLKTAKQEADLCLEHGLISESVPAPADYRMLFSPIIDPTSHDSAQTLIQDDITKLYLDRIRSTAAQIRIPIASANPEAAWEEAFRAIWTEPTLWELMFEAYRTRIMERLKRDGAGNAEISEIANLDSATAGMDDYFWKKIGDLHLMMEHTKLDVPFTMLEKCSVGDYLLEDQGGLYRTIRLSKELREKVGMAKELAVNMSRVISNAGEELQKKLRDAAVVEQAKKQLPQMVRLFTDTLLSEHIQVTKDSNNTKISVIFYETVGSTANSKLLVCDPEGREYPISMLESYENLYWLYCVFTEFMCFLKERLACGDGQDWYTKYQQVLNNDLLAQATTLPFEQRKKNLHTEAYLITFSTNPLTLKAETDAINEEFETNPPRFYQHLLETDFSDPELGESFAGKIRAFYTLLQKRL